MSNSITPVGIDSHQSVFPSKEEIREALAQLEAGTMRDHDRYYELIGPRQLTTKEKAELKRLAKKKTKSSAEKKKIRDLLKRRSRTPKEQKELDRLESKLGAKEAVEMRRSAAVCKVTRVLMGRRFIARAIDPKDKSKIADWDEQRALDSFGPFLVWLGNQILSIDPPKWVELMMQYPTQSTRALREYLGDMRELRGDSQANWGGDSRRRDTPMIAAVKKLIVVDQEHDISPAEWDDELNTVYTEEECRGLGAKDSERNRKLVKRHRPAFGQTGC